jgi:pyruvate/2-oxoglutarate/acetoin dehydrogenase E1 component
MAIEKEKLIDMYRVMVRIRTFEERVAKEFAAGNILDAPIKRVCAPNTPVPFSPVLEKFWMPDEDNLIKAINEIRRAK